MERARYIPITITKIAPMIPNSRSKNSMFMPAIETELKKSLAAGYFKNPQLSVAIEQYRSQRVFIVGEVKEPGTYPLTGDMTFIEAFSRAKSTTSEAAGQAVIVRPPPGKTAGPTRPHFSRRSTRRRGSTWT